MNRKPLDKMTIKELIDFINEKYPDELSKKFFNELFTGMSLTPIEILLMAESLS